MKFIGLVAILREFLKRSHYVGEIYMTVDGSFDPNVAFSGTWVRLPDGVFIRNAGGNAGAVGQVQVEGLPNLSGYFGNTDNAREQSLADGSLFQSVDTEYSDWTGGTQLWRQSDKVLFNAHSHNAIYGSSDHVTPYNMAVYMWRRTA